MSSEWIRCNDPKITPLDHERKKLLRKTDPSQFEEFLQDASRMSGGKATAVVFPETEKQISEYLKTASKTKTPITIAGNHTGLVGGAIPLGGEVLATSLMSKAFPREKKGTFYPPAPTEWNAFLGATIATNASGARTFKYGATRAYTKALRWVLSSGEILKIERGKYFFNNAGNFQIQFSKKHSATLKLPSIKMPKIKNAAGYFCQSGMDFIDLWIGSEGTLGVATEIELALIPKPLSSISSIVFFRKEVIGLHKKQGGLTQLHKVATDTATPDHQLKPMMQIFKQILNKSGIQYVIFGHIGNNHLHANLLPKNEEELEAAREVYLKLCREIVDLGGTVSAEHGIGKLKIPSLEIQYGKAALVEMALLKKALDPHLILGQGNIFPAEMISLM